MSSENIEITGTRSRTIASISVEAFAELQSELRLLPDTEGHSSEVPRLVQGYGSGVWFRGLVQRSATELSLVRQVRRWEFH